MKQRFISKIKKKENRIGLMLKFFKLMHNNLFLKAQ